MPLVKSKQPAKPAAREPLWKGPEANGPMGGVTFSMLTRFLTCRERFRVKYLEGVVPSEQFNHRVEYGNLWHAGEEALAAKKSWKDGILQCARGLASKYPMSRDDVDKWLAVCLLQFGEYVKYWSAHPDVKNRVPLYQEKVFDIWYKLPSGRSVKLRGKFDAVDKIDGKLYLQENKTKGDIDPVALQRHLRFDLQSMLYLTVLMTMPETKTIPLGGVRYNVVRRPLSGGKGTIKQHQPSKSNPRGESMIEFLERLRGIIEENSSEFFMRWKIEVTRADVDVFRRQCLDPILEQLCTWYQFVSIGDPWRKPPTDACSGIHWMHPFGSVNSIDEYGGSDIDQFIMNGDMAGLTRIDRLFTELQDA